ncbi:MAG: 50S ribosomal protein L18 [Spirochaetaceae bacterium]|nr:MAG: 50S ribosomal protein L18 [Spirochaetaceae bacterium]
MDRLEQKKIRRIRRKKHIRKLVSGVGDRPRMTVFKSGRYLYVQVIDDQKEQTLVSASNIEKELRKLKSTIDGAEKLGQVVAGRLKEKKIDRVVFDRNGYAYHGIVRSIAEGARKAGIQF